MTSPTTPSATSATTTSTATSGGATGATKAPEPEKASVTTETVTAQVEAVKDVEAPKEKVVRFKTAGAGIIRTITKEDWESIGIKDQDEVSFNVINNFTLPTSDFTREALRYCAKVDSGLEVVEKPDVADDDTEDDDDF